MKPFLSPRRDAVAAAWSPGDGVVLVSGGEVVPIPGRGDQLYPFRPHPEYYYLTDRERPGSVLAFDPAGGWTDFVPGVTESERVWESVREVEPHEGTAPRPELEGWLEARRGRPVAVLGCPLPGVEADAELSARLREELSHVRRPKDEEELSRIRQAVRATEAGFRAAERHVAEGVTEREVQIEIEAAFFRAGADRTAFDTIVASGPNAAVLHFAPSGRVLKRGELVLVDAGAECRGYAADVSRTYPVGGVFSPEQKAVYDVVLAAQEEAIGMCRAGTEFRDVHLRTAVTIARGLVDFGLLRGDPEALVEREVHRLFFPHGVGHLVGLGVRDASGRLPGREPSEHPALKNFRMDLPLRPEFVVTIEPGVYFIRALLEDPERRERHREEVDWGRVDRMLDFGGIRIEDDVRVTEGDPEVLTAAIPKER